jgi:hypothetical protein
MNFPTVLALGVIPVHYALVKQWKLRRASRSAPELPPNVAVATGEA